MFKADIKVTLKKSVFDPQGATVMHSLETLGFKSVNNVRIGKFIQVEIDGNSVDEANEFIEKMCDQLLANPVIESYTYEVEEIS